MVMMEKLLNGFIWTETAHKLPVTAQMIGCNK